MNTVSPWIADVKRNIENGTILMKKGLQDYHVEISNSGNSLWMMVHFPSSGQLAFRLAYAPDTFFENIKVSDTGGIIKITATLLIGQMEVEVRFPDPSHPLVHYTTTLKSNRPLTFPFWPRDIAPVTKKGNLENTAARIHVAQQGTRSGLMLVSLTKPVGGTFLYFQNLTAMSPYCEETKTSLSGAVGGAWPEIGFQLPASSGNPLPAGREFVISDAFISFTTDRPSEEVDTAVCFLEQLSRVYNVLPKPDTAYKEWREIAQNGLENLTNNKGCWSYANGHPYLNAYLCDYATPPESMVQLAVLAAVTEHSKWTGEKYPIADDLLGGLSAFYDEKLKMYSRWLPSQRSALDETEEQKSALIMDSWYLHHPLMNLSKLALDGHEDAKKLLLGSIDYAIKAAHHFDYNWPVFYKTDTFEITKAETSEGAGGEKDVAGGYAYLMYSVWQLTKDKRYLNEAKKAASRLKENGLDIFYQANNTAFSAVVMLRLYIETKDQSYLDTSYLCLAGIMSNVQLWECNYGYGKNFNNFFGIFPLSDAPYKAAYEEMEVYAALNDYIREAFAAKVPILPSLYILLPELVRYSIHRLSDYYPVHLPPDMISDEVKTGEVDNKLWIPLEDLYDGWQKAGQVGQEVYGAGVGFGVVPRQYVKFEKQGFILFTDYPVSNPEIKDGRITFKVIGNAQLSASMVLLPFEGTLPKLSAETVKGRKTETLEPSLTTKESITYTIYGDMKIAIRWS